MRSSVSRVFGVPPFFESFDPMFVCDRITDMKSQHGQNLAAPRSSFSKPGMVRASRNSSRRVPRLPCFRAHGFLTAIPIGTTAHSLEPLRMYFGDESAAALADAEA